MERKHDIRASQTLDTLNHLREQGIEKCSLIIRHSERFFTDDARMEPFMGLTENGKAVAYHFGHDLPRLPRIQLHSSFFGRCIETAYLIDKGYSNLNGQTLTHNQTDPTLAPFYIKDIEKAIELAEAQGTEGFLRNWFNHEIDESIMENPKHATDRLCDYMIQQADRLPEPGVAICVSHDWNIFPIKEFRMAINHETSGDVGYLDGLAFYKKDGRCHVTNFQSDPIPL